MKHYTINKFGGSSLANADSFRQVVNILQGQDQVAVVSAVAGITNALQNMLDVAVSQGDYQTILKNIIARIQVANAITLTMLELFKLIHNNNKRLRWHTNDYHFMKGAKFKQWMNKVINKKKLLRL